MYCSCGSETISKKVVREKKVIVEYEECKVCGRVEVIWIAEGYQLHLTSQWVRYDINTG